VEITDGKRVPFQFSCLLHGISILSYYFALALITFYDDDIYIFLRGLVPNICYCLDSLRSTNTRQRGQKSVCKKSLTQELLLLLESINTSSILLLLRDAIDRIPQRRYLEEMCAVIATTIPTPCEIYTEVCLRV
jgi:hypothetical protein